MVLACKIEFELHHKKIIKIRSKIDCIWKKMIQDILFIYWWRTLEMWWRRCDVVVLDIAMRRTKMRMGWKSGYFLDAILKNDIWLHFELMDYESLRKTADSGFFDWNRHSLCAVKYWTLRTSSSVSSNFLLLNWN